MWKYIFITIGSILLLGQLVQPSRTVPAVDPAADLFSRTQAPEDVQQLVIGACYDCHSYNTDYPWYAYVTPVNWILQDHINEGREVLNFSRWDQYAGSEAAAECGEEMAEGEMPPVDYARMHAHAQLSAADRDRLIAWFDGTGTARHQIDDDHHAEHDDDR
jgi:hypothetical protein